MSLDTLYNVVVKYTTIVVIPATLNEDLLWNYLIVH